MQLTTVLWRRRKKFSLTISLTLSRCLRRRTFSIRLKTQIYISSTLHTYRHAQNKRALFVLYYGAKELMKKINLRFSLELFWFFKSLRIYIENFYFATIQFDIHLLLFLFTSPKEICPIYFCFPCSCFPQ